MFNIISGFNSIDVAEGETLMIQYNPESDSVPKPRNAPRGWEVSACAVSHTALKSKDVVDEWVR